MTSKTFDTNEDQPNDNPQSLRFPECVSIFSFFHGIARDGGLLGVKPNVDLHSRPFQYAKLREKRQQWRHN